jgi:hypothetical protein
MTGIDALFKVEALQRACDLYHMRYSIKDGRIQIHANHTVHTKFAEDNTLFSACTVEEMLSWLTGAFGGFALPLNSIRRVK